MSISNQISSNQPRTKRRKLSNGEHHDHRIAQPSQKSNKDENSGSEEQQNAVTTGHASKKAAQRSKSSSALPAGGLNKSSVLAIQLNELLTKSTPRHDVRIAKLEPELERIKGVIRDIPKTEVVDLKDAEDLLAKAGVSIPFPSPKPGRDTNLKFQYDSPASLHVSSALHLRLSIKGSTVVKIIAEMPRKLLQEKDYLNLRAFHKRASYLAQIASHLKTPLSGDYDLKYALEDGLELLPSLILTPKDASGYAQQRCTTMITVGFPVGAFAIEKTFPTKNCVRPKIGPSQSGVQPTPVYNSILNSQMSHSHYDRLFQITTDHCPAFVDACRAGQIWLQKRGFDSNVASGGFGVREWATMSALLLQTGGHKGHALFSERYSVLQLFKAMLQVLSGRDMMDPWILDATKLSVPRTDIPCFYDGNKGVNILQKMAPSSYQALRHHARTSLQSVTSMQHDAFDVTFEVLVDEPQLQFDELYSVSIPREDMSPILELISRLYQVLQRGLGDRVTLLDSQAPTLQPWSLAKPQPRSKGDIIVELRLLLNTDATSRLIDHGPSADDQAAADDFRRFWGEKSELRRFKDGSISESLVWLPSKAVTEQIIGWLLERHFNASTCSFACRSPKLEDRLLGVDSHVSASEASRLINSQFQSLSSTLHQLEGLPLPIRSISQSDPALRSSTLNHPLLSRTATPVSMLVQFDSSTRWPDSLPAIQHTKIAFLLKVAELLSAHDSSLITRVGLENTSSQHSGYLNTSFLDIIYPQSHPQLAHITFRLRIHHDRELPLLQAQIAKSLSPTERSQTTSALTAHKRTLAAPLHTTTLRTLTTRFPPLSPTIRLIKAFFSAHHLSNLIPAELIDLIAAHIFLHPSPWSTPGSASTSFLRCLHFLSRWDWAVTPLIVDLSLSQEMSDSAREELKTRFSAWRRLDPQMNSVTWFVGTSVDGTGVVWSEGGRVEKVVAARVRALASVVIELVTAKRTNMSDDDWKDVFQGDSGEFDFVIRLNKSVGRGSQHSKYGKGPKEKKDRQTFKNLLLASQSVSTDDIGFDPVGLFLEDLQKAFGHVALVLHGEGQDVICGLWRPTVVGEKEWRVRLGWSSVPVRYKEASHGEKEEGEKVVCTINKEGVLAEIAMLGAGLVKDVKAK